MSSHMVNLRVWGDFACFTRPEMKVERVSYPICTPSAARGILEAVFWEPEIYYVIDSITVIKKGKWFSFRRNEVKSVISIKETMSWMQGKTLPKPIQAGGGADDAAQRNMLALREVEYVIKAELHRTKRNSRHELSHYPTQFMRRAQAGKCYFRPAFGCREFSADFEWMDSAESMTPLKWDEEFGIMLYDVFDHEKRAVVDEQNKNVHPESVFFNATIKDGVMDCHPERVKILHPAGKAGG